MIATRKRRRVGYAGLGLRGLAGCEPEDCGTFSNPSEQWNCVQRNEAKMDPITGRFCTPGSTGWIDTGHGAVYADNPSTYVPQSGVIYGANQTTTLAPSGTQTPSPSALYSPRVTFQSSRGGNILYPGDTWTISIAGGAPSSQVVVKGGKNGAQDSNSMGVTDAAGNFQLSGALTAGEIGSWSEAWSVGGAPAGSFSFVVQPTPSQQTTAPPVSDMNATGPAPTNNSTQPGPTGGFSLSDIPTWGWLAVGAGVLFMMKGGR